MICPRCGTVAAGQGATCSRCGRLWDRDPAPSAAAPEPPVPRAPTYRGELAQQAAGIVTKVLARPKAPPAPVVVTGPQPGAPGSMPAHGPPVAPPGATAPYGPPPNAPYGTPASPTTAPLGVAPGGVAGAAPVYPPPTGPAPAFPPPAGSAPAFPPPAGSAPAFPPPTGPPPAYASPTGPPPAYAPPTGPAPVYPPPTGPAPVYPPPTGFPPAPLPPPPAPAPAWPPPPAVWEPGPGAGPAHGPAPAPGWAAPGAGWNRAPSPDWARSAGAWARSVTGRSRLAAPAGTASPPNYLWQSLTCLLTLLPSALVAVLYSTQVNRRVQMGDMTGAERASRLARTWCFVTVVAFTVLMVWIALGGPFP
jgi:hypothetical protein